MHQVLSLDIPTVKEYFTKAQHARYRGKSWSRQKMIEQIAHLHNATIDRGLLQEYEKQLRQRKCETFRDIDRDVQSMLLALREKEIPIGVVANCEYLDEQYYSDSQLPGLVDTTVFSCEVGSAKPEPNIYEHALSLLDVPAADCAYIGAGLSGELDGAAKVGTAVYQAFWYLKNLDEKHKKRALLPFERLFFPMDSILCVGG